MSAEALEEIAAMGNVYAILKKFDEAARRRIVEWVLARLKESGDG